MADQMNTLSSSTLESLVLNGDLSRMTQQQKTEYYIFRCHQIGLDPASQPFQLLKLNGKEVLYAAKSCSEQLTSKHKLSVALVATEKFDDILMMTSRVTGPDGRFVENIGSVPLAGLKGEALSNAYMKCRTKSARRSVLSWAGLGELDEDEVRTIPGARTEPLPITEAIQEWSDEDEAQAKAAVMDMAEILYSLGVSEEQALVDCAKPLGTIGQDTPEKWMNRFLAYSERLQAKAKKSGPPELTGGGEVPEGPGVPPPEAIPLTLSQQVGENWDKLRKKWAAEPGMEDTHLDRRIKARIKTWAGDLDPASVEWLETVRAGQEEAMK